MRCADWIILPPFAQQANFFDPQYSSDGRLYGLKRYKEIVQERYMISKMCNTSYTDLSEVTPLEREYIIGFIIDGLKREKQMRDAAKANRN